MRSLQRADVPIDYGASWTTLFLSPLLGALAGWFGVAIITVLARPEINLLGTAFSVVNWDEPLRVATIAFACMLGVSERLFNSLVDVLEKQSAKTGNAGQPPTPPSPASPVSMSSALPGGSPPSAAAQPAVVAGQPAAAVDDLTRINQAIGTALTAGTSSIPVVQFLKGMGIQVPDGASGNDLLSLVRTMGLKAAGDPVVRSVFVAEARKAGLG